MPKNHFAYAKAEAVFDAFAKEEERSLQYRRAYLKFKFMLAAYAYVDFGQLDEAAMSYAWEDAQITFTGHGESALSGAVLQMWVHVGDEDEFKKVVVKAFHEAEEETENTVVRRYLSRDRHRKVRLPDEGFDLVPILPLFGPTLSDWALDMGKDPDEMANWFADIAEADCGRASTEKTAKKKKKTHLTLVGD